MPRKPAAPSGTPTSAPGRSARLTRNRLQRLADRHGNLCALCRKPVDLTITDLMHPKAPSLDHIHPRSLGGRDRFDNLQLTHRTCNNARGNTLLDTPAGMKAARRHSAKTPKATTNAKPTTSAKAKKGEPETKAAVTSTRTPKRRDGAAPLAPVSANEPTKRSRRRSRRRTTAPVDHTAIATVVALGGTHPAPAGTHLYLAYRAATADDLAGTSLIGAYATFPSAVTALGEHAIAQWTAHGAPGRRSAPWYDEILDQTATAWRHLGYLNVTQEQAALARAAAKAAAEQIDRNMRKWLARHTAVDAAAVYAGITPSDASDESAWQPWITRVSVQA